MSRTCIDSSLECLEALKIDASNTQVTQNNIQLAQLNGWFAAFGDVINTTIQNLRYIEDHCNLAISNKSIETTSDQSSFILNAIIKNNQHCTKLASEFHTLLEKASSNLLDETSLTLTNKNSDLVLKSTQVLVNKVNDLDINGPRRDLEHDQAGLDSLMQKLEDKANKFKKSFAEGNQNNLPTTLSEASASAVQEVNNGGQYITQ